MKPPHENEAANDAQTITSPGGCAAAACSAFCECIDWCRTDIAQHGRRADGLPILTHHHPRCEHYNDSLIDVWKVGDGSTSYYDASEEGARSEASNGDGFTVEKIQMHREVYEQLPEFDGF